MRMPGKGAHCTVWPGKSWSRRILFTKVLTEQCSKQGDFFSPIQRFHIKNPNFKDHISYCQVLVNGFTLNALKHYIEHWYGRTTINTADFCSHRKGSNVPVQHLGELCNHVLTAQLKRNTKKAETKFSKPSFVQQHRQRRIAGISPRTPNRRFDKTNDAMHRE